MKRDLGVIELEILAKSIETGCPIKHMEISTWFQQLPKHYNESFRGYKISSKWFIHCHVSEINGKLFSRIFTDARVFWNMMQVFIAALTKLHSILRLLTHNCPTSNAGNSKKKRATKWIFTDTKTSKFLTPNPKPNHPHKQPNWAIDEKTFKTSA